MGKKAQKMVVTGEMRSGSTFLANWLNSQPDFVVYADTLINLFMEAKSLNLADIHAPLDEVQKNVLLSSVIAEGFNKQLDFGTIGRKDFDTWFELFERCLETIQGDQSPRFVGIKKTREDDYIGKLLDSGVKVIYVCRDPRDVVLSGRNRFGNFDLFKTLENWRCGVAEATRRIGHPDFLFLKFEDLIGNRDETVKGLEKFFGVSLETTGTELRMRGEGKYVENSSFGDVRSLFDRQSIGRWRDKTDNSDVRAANAVLRREIAFLGYPEHGMDKPSRETRKFRNYRIKKEIRRRLNKMFRFLEI